MQTMISQSEGGPTGAVDPPELSQDSSEKRESITKAVQVLWESEDLSSLTKALDRIEADCKLHRSAKQKCPSHSLSDLCDENTTSSSSGGGGGGGKATSLSSDRSVSSSDPSGIFLAIQASFLRVTGTGNGVMNVHVDSPDSARDDNGGKTEYGDASMRRRYAVRSLTVTEALARTVVGPAWHSQLQNRRRNRQCRSATVTGNIDGECPDPDEATPKESDPTLALHSTCSPENRTQRTKHDDHHPAIPELLPAAMIRFAAFFASANDGIQKDSPVPPLEIFQMQVSIVRALAFPPTDTAVLPSSTAAPESFSGSWQLVGVHAEMTAMVQVWLHRVSSSAAEGKGTAASADDNLWSNDGLLELANQILSLYHDLLRVGGWRPCPPLESVKDQYVNGNVEAEPSCQAWCQNAVYALMTAVHASDKPEWRHQKLPLLRHRSLLCLHQMAEMRLVPEMTVPALADQLLSLLPCKRGDDAPVMPADVSLDLALETFFVLLQHETTAASTMDELLDRLGVASHSALLTNKASWSAFILSTALWGSAAHESPTTTSSLQKKRSAIPMLRVFFEAAIQSLLRALNLCVDWASDLTGLDVDPQRHEAGAAMAGLAGDLLSALCRTTCSQCFARTDASAVLYLSVIEWDRMISSLESCVVPWLLPGGSQFEVARQAASTLIRQIGVFLEYSADVDTVPFVEYEHQRAMYLCLLRRAIPLLDDDRTRSQTARSVLRNWIKYGLFPFRLEGWNGTAGCILHEAFRKRASDSSSTSRYVFDASVRLEALKGLTAEHPSEWSVSLDSETVPTLLVFTQHMRELHLDLIRTAIIPCLEDTFRNTHGYDRSTEEGRNEPSGVDNADPLAPEIVAEGLGASVSASAAQNADVEIAIYCVQLAGRLYRSVSGDRELRVRFVDMLEDVALAGEARQRMCVRVQAVLELSRCLEAAFVTLLHAHESVPRLIQSLCNVLDRVSAVRQVNSSESGSEASEVYATVLGVAAMDPLTRLRVAIDGKVAFRAREKSVNDTSALLLPFFAEAIEEYRSAVVETYGSPCVGIDGMICRSSSATRVNPICIIQSVVTFLQTFSTSPPPSSRPLSFALKCMRIHSFDILRHQFLASIPVRLPIDVARTIFASAHSTTEDTDGVVSVARCLALIRCAENAVILIKCKGAGDESTRQSDVEFVPVVLDLVLETLKSPAAQARVIACQGLAALIPSLHYLDMSCSTRLVTQITRFLATIHPTNQGPTSTTFRSTSILTLVHDLSCCPIELSDELVAHFLRMTCLVEADGSFESHLASECSAMLLDRMTLDGLNQVILDAGAYRAFPTADKVLIELAIALSQQRRTESDRLEQGKEHTKAANGALESLSGEVASMEAFQSCQNAAWLLSDRTLLTCRIGTPRTRNSGFIELATRTLAGRSRKLIRIPNSVSVNDPEFPSLLLLPHENDESSPWPLSSARVESDVDIPAQSVAAAAIERYNRVMFHPASHGVSDDESGSHEDNVEESPTAGDTNIESNEAHSVVGALSVTEWLTDTLSLSPKDIASLAKEIELFLSRTTTATTAECKLMPSAQLDREIAVLDRTPCSTTYKIGLLYDQSATMARPLTSDIETGLLMARACSPAFYKFARHLGNVVPNGHLKYYSGGLDTTRMESDGKFALVWTEKMDNMPTPTRRTRSAAVASRHIVFHSVDMMPWDGPAARVARKRHIGNDFVLILFADRGSDAIVEFDLKGGDLIGGAFGFVVIWVTVAQPGIFRINVRVRRQRMNDELNAALLPFVSDYAIAEVDAPRFVRNIAMRADLACRAATGAADAPSNYVYRHHLLREMKRFAILSKAASP